MNMEQKVKMALAYSGVSQAEAARQIGESPSNFNQKVKKNTLNKETLEAFAAVIGAKYICCFEFPDGTKI